MNSLYEEYVKCSGFDTIQIPDVGFCTYKIAGNECYIRDIYVRTQFRKLGTASKLADLVTRIAKTRHCTYLVGTVDLTYTYYQQSRDVLTGYGMQFYKAMPSYEIYCKGI